jgi:hypothetical protein
MRTINQPQVRLVNSGVHTEWLLLVALCYFEETNFLAVGTSYPVKQYQRYCKQ